MNRVVLVGRLTKDPVLKMTQTGKSCCTFTVACDGYGDQTDYINCQAWNQTAENVAKYLTKGSMVGVDGKIQTRSYTTQDGQNRYVTEVLAQSVQFLTPKQNQANTYPNQNDRADKYTVNYDAENDVLDITSDDLPF